MTKTCWLVALQVAANLCCFAPDVRATDWPQWRGPNRDGISKESGLLSDWPKEGPKLLWQSHEIGSGYSTPAVIGDRLYLLANEGLDNEFVVAVSAKDGKRIWSSKLGKVGKQDQQPSFPAARSTPTIDSEKIYALGSDGDLACMDLKDGKIRWKKNLQTEFGGKPGVWAYSESPLIDGQSLICTPGGETATLVALNKNTGEAIWKCAVPGGGDAAYSSAIIVDTDGVKQYVQLFQKGLIGVDAKTGKFLWRWDKPISKYGANIPTPVADHGLIYCGSAGTGAGLVQLKLTNGVPAPEQVYFETKLPTAIGGVIKVGDYLYGTTSQGMLCVEFATGKVKWQSKALGAASLCCAGNRLYLHGENGGVSLIEASPDDCNEFGKFTPPNLPKHSQEMEKSWAYPVVSNGRLYIRDGDSLWCYDVSAKSSQIP